MSLGEKKSYKTAAMVTYNGISILNAKKILVRILFLIIQQFIVCRKYFLKEKENDE